MEKLTWFKFVISDWMMGKIQKCPEVTQARFIRLCCLYWNKECHLSFEDAEIEIDLEHLHILISKKIVIKNDEFVTIKFLDEQNSDVSNLSEKRREAVKSRWDKLKQIDTNVLKSDTIVIQNDTEKNRVEKNRVEKNVDDIKSTPSFIFFTMKDFEEQVEIGENEFTLLAVRQTKLNVMQLKIFLADFINTQKSLTLNPWKNSADAKKHFIAWVKKQPIKQGITIQTTN